VARLLALFVLVPLAELMLLIEIGRYVGLLPTLALVVVTGVVGAWLARRQGLTVLGQVRAEMADGRIPAGPVMDGVLILVAGAVLMTPGVLTDLFGFFCLVPAGRRLLRKGLMAKLEGAVRRGNVAVDVGFAGATRPAASRHNAPGSSREVRDVTPEDER
jgi:UPF0716 protein FxsA